VAHAATNIFTLRPDNLFILITNSSRSRWPRGLRSSSEAACFLGWRVRFPMRACKKKGKAVPLHAMEALGGESRYSSYSFTTSASDGVSGQRHAPAAFLPPGKGPPVPIVQEAGWTPEPVWTQRLEEKSSAPFWDRTSIARSSSP
jgi:hypothetical protein